MLNDVLQKIKDFPEEPFVDRVCEETEIPDIFNWKDVSNLIRINENKFEIINDKNDKIAIPAKHVPWHGGIQDKQFLYDKILEGNGFVILNQSYYNSSMNGLTHFIETSTGKSTDIHIYGAYDSSGKSFGAHSDLTANMILQVDGTSLWRVYAEKSDSPQQKDSSELTEVINQKLLPGMVLYIPHRTYHKCEPLTKRLSFSFAMSSSDEEPAERKEYDL